MNARKSDTEDRAAGETVQSGPPVPSDSADQAEHSLEERLQAAADDRDANYDRFVRTQAEFDNYRKRVQKEAEETRRYQALPIVRELLPALDNLGRAIAAADTTDKEELVKGVQMVAAQFDAILASHSVVPIEALGQPFDPNRHEALQQVPTDEQPPLTVLEEVERGYLLHDRVVRPSKVIVSAELPNQADSADEADSTDQSP